MADKNFLEQLKKMRDDFEKNARPKFEKTLDEYSKKIEDLGKQASREAEDTARRVTDTGKKVAGNARREFEAIVDSALDPIRHISGLPDSARNKHGAKQDPRHRNPSITEQYKQKQAQTLVPKAERYDAAKATQDILNKLNDKDVDGAIKRLAYLGKEIQDGRADPQDVDMNALIDQVTKQYHQGVNDHAHELAGWTIELADSGADMSKVDPAPIRDLVERKLEQQDFGAAREVLLWARFVENAVASSQRPRTKPQSYFDRKKNDNNTPRF